MPMTYEEWKHERDAAAYIEDNAQYQLHKRMLEAIGRFRGWLNTPEPQPTWFDRQMALAKQLIAGEPVKTLEGETLLVFADLERKVFDDREWLPVALQYASRKEDQQAAAWLSNALLGCAMKLIAQYRTALDPNWKPMDEAFFDYITHGKEEVA